MSYIFVGFKKFIVLVLLEESIILDNISMIKVVLIRHAASIVDLPQPDATAASKYQSPYLRTGLMEVASSVGFP
jgi:hypothetical protein